jgi:hypothetical protein
MGDSREDGNQTRVETVQWKPAPSCPASCTFTCAPSTTAPVGVGAVDDITMLFGENISSHFHINSFCAENLQSQKNQC